MGVLRVAAVLVANTCRRDFPSASLVAFQPLPMETSSSHSLPVRIATPSCANMMEHPAAAAKRAWLNTLDCPTHDTLHSDPLATHLLHGLAYTVGSALGNLPPNKEQCLAAFLAPNKVGLTAGARAWSKHGHRSGGHGESGSDGRLSWWGQPSGPVAKINDSALALFWRVIDHATWRNLHWMPHEVLVYEVRVQAGYGMRWSQDLSGLLDDTETRRPREGCIGDVQGRGWLFRGFVEPMMENGHELGWRH